VAQHAQRLFDLAARGEPFPNDAVTNGPIRLQRQFFLIAPSLRRLHGDLMAPAAVVAVQAQVGLLLGQHPIHATQRHDG
jgi:hypothetical protein